MTVINSDDFDPTTVDVVFTAAEVEKEGMSKREATQELETRFAQERPTISTTSAFRYEDDVPILIPAVNNAHAALVKRQAQRGWKGFVVPIPNCTTTGMAITLKPLYDAFGINFVIMTSLQALSGAGRRGGVLGLDILDNVIPYIVGEEEKVQRETQKILGAFDGGKIKPADFKVSCTCTRVNVQDGHTEAVFVSLASPASVEDVKRVMSEFGRDIADLPSAPPQMIVVHDDPFHPQPKRDRDLHDGMATVVGRVREDTALPNGVKYVLLSHNTKMGAAKGAVLVAELMVKEGLI
jgi:aspartate-semialdehyde dehydrogenase